MNLVGISLIVTSILILVSSKIDKNNKNKKEMTKKKSFIIGLFQSIAILPGISRSGSTISGSMVLGIDREKAVRFSFILAIPALIGAALLNINEVVRDFNYIMLIGSLISGVVSYFVLKFLINIVKKGKFSYFGWYCLVVGISVIVFSLNSL